VTLTFEDPSKEDIQNLCAEISSKTNRIKGIFSSEDKSYYTEYIDDTLKLEEINYTGENYLICLSTKKDYLKKELEEILKKSKYYFAKTLFLLPMFPLHGQSYNLPLLV